MKPLTQADRISPIWANLSRQYKARLEELRIQNDSDLDPVKTARLRGQIKEILILLSLGETQATQDGGVDDE